MQSKRYGEYVDRNGNTAPGPTLEELATYFPEPHNAIRTELARDLLAAQARIKELEEERLWLTIAASPHNHKARF